jgi:trehalose synthase
VKETNWSVTRPVKGVDGVVRRWVYLHYFKEGQPSINWIDPSFAGMKLVVGDALHSIGRLGTTGLRLDANGFLGIEKMGAESPAWSEGHPLSVAANQLVASMVRKVGGFTFQELNLSMDDIKVMGSDGADLSYDFINRPAYHFALATADTEFLRLTLRLTLKHGVDPASLIHALQNHDELTYELVHFWTHHKDDEFPFRGSTITGSELRQTIQKELRATVTGTRAPYNRLFTENGIACTTVSFISAALGFPDPTKLTPHDVEEIRKAHLLLAMFNAWQPGVFALSGWDLIGALTLPAADVAELISDGDTRWINRGAYDLMGYEPLAKSAASGLKKAPHLYAPLPDQLGDESSFASRLKRILETRRAHGIASARQIDVPEVSHKGLLVMVHELQMGNALQLTLLNFAAEEVNGTIYSEYLPPGASVHMLSGPSSKPLPIGTVVDELHNFPMTLDPREGAALLVVP